MKPAKLNEIAETCTCFHLRKATRAVTQVFDEILAPAGLRATQFTLLAALANLKTVTVSHLAQGLVMDRTTLTRNLKPLQQKRWVQVVPGEDRRTRALTLTAKGHQTLENALPLWEQAQRQVVERIGKSRWSGLMDHLGSTSTLVNPY